MENIAAIHRLYGYKVLDFTQAVAGPTATLMLAEMGFTTLTTLGFGDILPLSPVARSLVLEALVGQLFPVILIARLVAMEIEYHRSRQP